MPRETKSPTTIRVKPSDKTAIQGAADQVGESLSEFVVTASLDRTKKVVKGCAR